MNAGGITGPTRVGVRDAVKELGETRDDAFVALGPRFAALLAA